MLINLIRNQSKGASITGRLVINGRWFCNTLERVGYQIPALCYQIRVTNSPKFKRLLPVVQNVPRTLQSSYGTATPNGPITNSEASNRAKPVQYPAAECRTGIRFHRGTKPQHSTGCILVLGDENLKQQHQEQQQEQLFRGQQHSPRQGGDNALSPAVGVCCAPTEELLKKSFETFGRDKNKVVYVVDNNNPSRGRDIDCRETLSKLSSTKITPVVVGGRTAADVEQELTQLLLQTQNNHEEIILEVSDYRPGTEYGYNTPCPPELQKR